MEIQKVVDQQTHQQLAGQLHCHSRDNSTTVAPTDGIAPTPTHPALAIIAARPDIFAQQGSVVPTWRRHGARTYGPYYRLNYRDGGRQYAVYLGPAGSLVEQIRHKLDVLKKPLHRCRAVDRLRRQVSASLRIEKRQAGMLLRRFGLRLQGFEVRGWRTSPLRTLATRIRRFRKPPLRHLRFHPKGSAAAALRNNKSTIPRSPQARLEAVLAARRGETS